MEETRVSRMYLNLMTRMFGRAFGNVVGGAWLGSPITWIVVAVLALVGVGVAVHEKGRGDVGRLKSDLGAQPAEPDAATDTPGGQMPGGQAPILLTRTQQVGAFMPEFVSATVLPGRGMNVLQIKAFLPGRGVVSLLDSPGIADASRAMTGSGDDANGQASLAQGAPFEVPWAGRIGGATLPGGLSVLTNWNGRGLTLPVNWSAGGAQGAEGGLLLRRGANTATPSVMPDGGVANGSFEAEDFDGHWASKTSVTTSVLLSARTIDLTVVARNVGSEPEPMGIGWRPRFALPGGDRAQVRLRLPSTARAEAKDRESGLPNGRVAPVEGTAFDFSKLDGVALGNTSLNDLYVLLKSGPLSAGPEVELRDPAAHYGLRLVALTPSIKALRVIAPAGANYVSIDPQTNDDDPFGREWGKEAEAGMVVLQPQQSLQWKVRLELFTVGDSGVSAPHLTSPGQ